MPKELDLQAKLVKAAKDAGGYGYKQSNKFLAGPPDLYLSHPATGAVFIEVKKNHPGQKNVGTTPLQRTVMKQMQMAGSKCGVVVVIPLPDIIGGYDIFVSKNIESLRIDESWLELRRRKGEDWPISEIMRHCAT